MVVVRDDLKTADRTAAIRVGGARGEPAGAGLDGFYGGVGGPVDAGGGPHLAMGELDAGELEFETATELYAERREAVAKGVVIPVVDADRVGRGKPGLGEADVLGAGPVGVIACERGVTFVCRIGGGPRR